MNKIKEIRIKKNMTQEELAKKSGISRPYISRLENNEEMIIKSSTMVAIADALGKPVSYIFFK
ncbi:helix-turn-helix transcriptional regulator [uncultured Thomasclavelia sp.]|mgnify:CR=1 FL=1|uniref:helix-turn-helix domain-containing protein n=1 Tax=uncultured Thomasclavelia sp. TaxID=3025759 RepID=UPI00261296D9|nr:helix-turn-helix transcriptional regulator [uncultured Thomasclavelia sp.]